MHEGVIYPCHQWDYFATDTSSLMKHVKIKHKVWDKSKGLIVMLCDYRMWPEEEKRFFLVNFLIIGFWIYLLIPDLGMLKFKSYFIL